MWAATFAKGKLAEQGRSPSFGMQVKKIDSFPKA